MKNILITGANRGLGLGFVNYYLQRGERVWASYRDSTLPPDVMSNRACTAIKWDVSQPLATSEQAKLPDQINLLINNAGVYGPKDDGQSLQNISREEMLRVFAIDAVAPLGVVQSLLPRLRKGRASIANISSKMGSASDNTSGGAYAYRAAKSALCIISKSMAVDLAEHNIQVICMHPGWVQTDMTRQTGLVDVETSVAGMASVIDNISKYEPGAFVAFDGVIIPY